MVKKFVRSLVLSAAIFGMASPAMASDPSGNYKRKDGSQVKVWVENNKLYCKITTGKKKNFEMCHGMTQSGDAWKGKKMKHPGMPGFMTFNGTVTSDATTMKIKGCAMGQSMCDSEVWTRIP